MICKYHKLGKRKWCLNKYREIDATTIVNIPSDKLKDSVVVDTEIVLVKREPLEWPNIPTWCDAGDG